MGLYRQHRLSIIRHIKALGQQLVPVVGTFVDLDAHAELDTLPKADFLGIAGYSMSFAERNVVVFASYVVATWNDPDLMRLTSMADLVTDALLPQKKVELFMQNPGAGYTPTWMIVGDEMLVEPVDKTDQRAMQFMTARFLSSQTT